MIKVLAKSGGKSISNWTNTDLNPLWGQLGITLLGFLLARAVIMGELYPFGLSFITAVVLARPQNSKAALLGVLTGTLFTVKGLGAVPYLGGQAIIYMILSRRQNRENHWVVLPLLVAAVNLLIRGIGVLASGNDLYIWVGVVFESFFTAVLTLVCITGIIAYPKITQGETLTAEERTSLGVLILGVLVGIAGTQAWDLGLQSVCSRLLVLWASLIGGPGGGSAVGVAVGLVPSIQGSLTAGPMAFYALSGMLGGIFNQFGKIGVVIGFTLSNLLLSLFFPEQVVIARSFWESGLAMLIFFIFNPPVFKKRLEIEEKAALDYRDKSFQLAAKLQKISQIFYDLEKVFSTQHYKEHDTELSVLFNKVASQVCDGCSLRRVCWEQEFYKTYRAMLEACAKLETTGSVTEKEFGTLLKKRCMRLRELSVTLNSQLELVRLINAYQKQLNLCGKLVNNQLLGLARLVEDFSQELKAEVAEDSTCGQFLTDALGEKGIKIKDISVFIQSDGEKEIIIRQDTCPEKNWCKSMIAPNISQVMRRTYIVEKQECSGKGNCTYHLIPSRALQISVGKAQCPKEGEKVSGDVCSALNLPDHRLALIMSDGMGTGEDALAESQVAASLVGKLLKAGFSIDTTVKTVNAALFLRSGAENFATLDVVLVNEINGQADFIKIGGAPTLICSTKGLKIVKAFSPPAGILDSIEPQTYRQILFPGSLVIMMSDGVWEAIHNAEGPEGWFEETLKQMDFTNPQKVASYLLFLAKKASNNLAKDDMCIQVAWIEESGVA